MSLFFEVSLITIAGIHTLIYFIDVMYRINYEMEESDEELPENVRHLYS